MAKKVGIDRRKLLRNLGLLGTVGLAGCGESESNTSAQTGSTGDSQSDGAGGELHVGLSAGPTELNPMFMTKGVEYVYSSLAYSALYRLDTDMSIIPDLAIDEESNDDLTEWTLTLREDATFNNIDQTVMAEDVVSTFETMDDPDTGAAGMDEFGGIESVEVVDDFRVRFNLVDPTADYPAYLSRGFGNVLPKQVIEDDFESISNEDYGSGPFNIVDYTIGETFQMEANENYYLTDGEGNDLPLIDTLYLDVLPDANTRTTSIQNGSIDIDETVPPGQIGRIESLDAVRALSKPGGSYYSLTMDAQTEPFNDNRVRQAIKYAIDKEAILANVGKGHGVLGQDNPIGPASRNYADLSQKFGPGQMLDEAQELMDDAGYGDGIELDFVLHAPPVRPQIPSTAVIIQDNLSQIGIEFDIERTPWESFLSEVEAQEPFYVVYYFMNPTVYNTMSVVSLPGGAYYGMNWENQEFRDALRDAKATEDPDERERLYKEAQRLMQEKGPFIVPYFENRLGAVREEVNGYDMHVGGQELLLSEVTKSN
jgi:peptide/nickel transport system substrate-binding protein